MAITETGIGDLPLVHRGKVRDTYSLDGALLMIASDRISAFDWVLPTPIPDKGRVLTGMSAYWFRLLGDLVPNHMITDGSEGWPADLQSHADVLDGRAMVVRRAVRIDYECVVRGYLAGSGWKEYQECGTLADEPLPAGLLEGEQLSKPRFTPARKNETGHDENIPLELLRQELGAELAAELCDRSMRLYEAGREHVTDRGLILADTKFEFGYVDGELTLIDEALTPDSSRYWLAEEWQPGRSQPSLDKQYVRDWLLASPWDRESLPPALPNDVVAATRGRYLDAYKRITGKELA